LHYLSGRHADGTGWLPARLSWAEEEFTVRDERTARILRCNVGTILGEQTREVRLEQAAPAEAGMEDNEWLFAPSRLVGEVSEAFAERLQPGDRFLLDGRCLELRRHERQTLVVSEVPGRPAVPRWGSEGLPLSPELARRLYLLRTQAAEAL